MILNPITRKEVFKPSEIVKVCADYVQNLLTHKEPKEDFKEDMI